MINLKKDDQTYGLLINADGSIERLPFDEEAESHLSFMYDAIGCDLVEYIGADRCISNFVLTGKQEGKYSLDYWFDQEYCCTHDMNAEKPNHVASVLANRPIYGNMLVLLSDKDGASHGLTAINYATMASVCGLARNVKIVA